MGVIQSSPKPLQSQLIKVWSFTQNADGTFSPASASGGGGGGGNSNITGINGIAPALTNPLAVLISDGTNPFGTAVNPLSTLTGQTAEATAAWTSGTSSNAAVTVTVQGLNTVIVTLNQGTTITGGVVTFEVSDTVAFTNPYTILATPTNNFVSTAPATTFSLVASTNSAFSVNVAGWAAFRVRLSTVISGSATVNVGVTASSAATTPVSIAGGEGANYLFNGGVSVITAASASDGGTSASYLTSSGGGNRVGTVQLFLATGPVSIAANCVAQRTPNIFKTANIAATSTTTSSNPIWTPTSGKKFRLMKFQITAQGLSATATAAVTVTLVDLATLITIGSYDVDVPAVANVVSGINQISGGWIDLGNGYLSLAANNVLNFGISAAGSGTVGTYRINVCGTEE